MENLSGTSLHSTSGCSNATTPQKSFPNVSKSNSTFQDLTLTLSKCKEYERHLEKEKSELTDRHQLWLAMARRIREDREYFQLQRNLYRKSY